MREFYEEMLDVILSGDPDELLATHRKAYRDLAGRREGNLVLCGCGSLGRQVLNGLRKAGREPLAFCDNNAALWGQSVDGIGVLAPQVAAKELGEKALFVATVYTSGPLLDQMKALGTTVVSFPDYAWVHPDAFLPHMALDLPHRIFHQSKAVREALALWQDEASCREYIGQLRWRTSLERDALPKWTPPDQTYFPGDLIPDEEDEVFVDCGAYDGDTLRAFLALRAERFKSIVAIEADQNNYGRLVDYVDTLEERISSKIDGLNLAIGSQAQTMRFRADGTVGSSEDESGLEITCLPLDTLLQDRQPTFIKMDIEGGEREALIGAREVIAAEAPVLAVCLYHKPGDLWQIPLLIKSLNSNYQLFLRRYSDECWEQVCYAVHPRRLRQL